MKKLAILPLSAAFLLLAVGSASACWGRNCYQPPSTSLKNKAEITQVINVAAMTGLNEQNDWLKAYKVYCSGIDVGGSRVINTGNAKVNVYSENWANINKGLRAPVTVRNKAEVTQVVDALAMTGQNTQNSAADVSRILRSGIEVGDGSRHITTGMADVSVGTVNKVNYNLR